MKQKEDFHYRTSSIWILLVIHIKVTGGEPISAVTDWKCHVKCNFNKTQRSLCANVCSGTISPKDTQYQRRRGIFYLLRVLSKIETDSHFWIAVSEDKRGGLFRKMSSICAAQKFLILQNKCLITAKLLKSYNESRFGHSCVLACTICGKADTCDNIVEYNRTYTEPKHWKMQNTITYFKLVHI